MPVSLSVSPTYSNLFEQPARGYRYDDTHRGEVNSCQTMQVSGIRSEKKKKQISLALPLLSFLLLQKSSTAKYSTKMQIPGMWFFRKRFPKDTLVYLDQRCCVLAFPANSGGCGSPEGMLAIPDSGWSGRSRGLGRRVWGRPFFFLGGTGKGWEGLARGLSRIGRQGGFVY